MNVYDELRKAGCTIENHCSDLYTPVNDTSRPIVRRYALANPHIVTTFVNQRDGDIWYDIAFAFAPFWEAASARKDPRLYNEAEPIAGQPHPYCRRCHWALSVHDPKTGACPPAGSTSPINPPRGQQ